MIFMGLLMFTGRMNAVTGYLSRFQTQSSARQQRAGRGWRQNSGHDGRY